MPYFLSFQSLLIKVVVGHSDHEQILRMVGLVPGDYEFTLNVTDAQGKHGTDTARVTVKQG